MICPAGGSKVFQILHTTNFGEPSVEFIGSSILAFLYEKKNIFDTLKPKLSLGVAPLDDSEKCMVPMS